MILRGHPMRRDRLGNMLSTIPSVSLVTPMSDYEKRTGMRGLGDTTAVTTTTADTSDSIFSGLSSVIADITVFAKAHPATAGIIALALLKRF